MRTENKPLTYFENNGKELWDHLKALGWEIMEEFTDGVIFLHDGLYIIIDDSDPGDPYVAVSRNLYCEAALEVCRKENSISHLFWIPASKDGIEWHSIENFILIDDKTAAIIPEKYD